MYKVAVCTIKLPFSSIVLGPSLQPSTIVRLIPLSKILYTNQLLYRMTGLDITQARDKN